MNWYYVDAGQQAGPVDDAQLAALASSGKIQPDTLVWREGMSGWIAYRDAIPSQAAPPLAPEVGVPPGPTGTAPAGGVICCECGQSFAPDQVIRHGDKWVCGNCKPIFLQRLREGATLSSSSPRGATTQAEVLARDYQVDIGGCLSQAWELFKTNAGIMIGASVLVYVAMMGSQIIPYAGIVLALIFNGPLMGGLWFFYIKKVRGQEAGVGDAFSGFGPKFWQFVLTQLVPSLIIFGMLFAIGLVAALVIPGFAGRGGTRSGSMAGLMAIPLVIGFVLFMIVTLYISVCWLFALPLVADKGMKFWPAMQFSRQIVSKHFWMTLLLVIVCGFLGSVGILACCLGILVTGPVAFATLACHYERVLGDLMPSQG